jgi:hypothetical protein
LKFFSEVYRWLAQPLGTISNLQKTPASRSHRAQSSAAHAALLFIACLAYARATESVSLCTRMKS